MQPAGRKTLLLRLGISQGNKGTTSLRLGVCQDTGGRARPLAATALPSSQLQQPGLALAASPAPPSSITNLPPELTGQHPAYLDDTYACLPGQPHPGLECPPHFPIAHQCSKSSTSYQLSTATALPVWRLCFVIRTEGVRGLFPKQGIPQRHDSEPPRTSPTRLRCCIESSTLQTTPSVHLLQHICSPPTSLSSPVLPNLKQDNHYTCLPSPPSLACPHNIQTYLYFLTSYTMCIRFDHLRSQSG